MTKRSQASAAKPAILAETERAQLVASDPAASAWVSANAGAGKTHVLKMRVLRLLLAGALPERILCLTYTKAAAAEMASRVFADLSAWATLDDASLDGVITPLLQRHATPDERSAARQLFARAIETPGGLKVQTIHAFCERLLQRFPLEAGVPPGFAILDDQTGATLLRAAVDEVLVEATTAPNSPLGHALHRMVAFAAGDGFDEILRAALSHRDWLDQMSRAGLRGDDEAGEIDALYRRLLQVRPGATIDGLVVEMASLLDEAQIARAQSLLAGGAKTDIGHAATLSASLRAQAPSQRAALLADYFLTGDGSRRARLLTKSLKDASPDLDEMLTRAQNRFHALTCERNSLVLTEATVALVRLADAVMQRYRAAKARRAALDFEDLIAQTARLLSTSAQTEWVLYKLDGGLDHILVDEAQDTSRMQWQIVEALAREFFSGAGARENVRTLFAVGDEKQSIYSFQGAAPKMFADTGRSFARLAAQAAMPWRVVPLSLSFRTVEPILATVDRTFADPVATPGLSASQASVVHSALRKGQAGLVEIWPTEVWSEQEATDAYSPLAETGLQSPSARLAGRIADTISAWLANGEQLISQNRPVKAGDIVILVRKRNPFAAPMVAALKAREIAVAGADRLVLSDQIAVQDLIALGDFLVLPEDDLALAAVLKSPIFGMTDDDLLAFAPDRKGSLWRALLDHARHNQRFAPPAELLKQWRAKADFTPPYEFLASLLDEDGLRARMLARLGPDAADPIDELLNLALTYDDTAPPSLQGFLTWLRSGRREIKRDMEHGRDAVRVMTVHGAKGLEAPIVFLPDTCSAPTSQRPGRLLQMADGARPTSMDEPYLWPVKGTSKVGEVEAAKSATARRELEESHRLLYVAMTRARDRLYVAGFEGKNGRARGCWYDVIDAGLGANTEHAPGLAGLNVRRISSTQSAATEQSRTDAARETMPATPPEWARRRVRSEPQLTMPLAPSRLAPYEVDEEGEPLDVAPSPRLDDEPAHPSPRTLAADNRFLRGTLTHALFEHLPAMPDAQRGVAARRFLEVRGSALSVRTRESIANEVLSVIADPGFAAVFGPKSRAEVPIAAEIAPPHGRGPALRVVGQIDRIAVFDDHVLLIDYKTNRPPPSEVADVAPAYLYQLAAYRLALAKIFEGRPVRAAILWTDGARLMPIDDDVLSAHEHGLWDRQSEQSADWHR